MSNEAKLAHEANRGFKVWVRADAVNEYFCDFKVYTGRAIDGETTYDLVLEGQILLELTVAEGCVLQLASLMSEEGKVPVVVVVM